MAALTFPALATKVPDEASAWKYLETIRWQGRPVCPHCGVIDGHYFLKPRNGARTTRTGAPTVRRLWKCHACRKQFSVLTGTAMHRSKVPVRTWVFVMFEMASSKNGVSARELERKYGLASRTAWFLAHRLREAMQHPSFRERFTGTVEADETYIGGRHDYRRHGPNAYGRRNKTPVFTIIERESGHARSRVTPTVNAQNIARVLWGETDRQARLMTDQANYYPPAGRYFARHETVNHQAREYARGDAHTNTAEGFFSQLKRSLDGTHHAVSREHLDRYLAEFDFRYNTRRVSDAARMEQIAQRVAGRRLTYRESPSEPSASVLVA